MAAATQEAEGVLSAAATMPEETKLVGPGEVVTGTAIEEVIEKVIKEVVEGGEKVIKGVVEEGAKVIKEVVEGCKGQQSDITGSAM